MTSEKSQQPSQTILGVIPEIHDVEFVLEFIHIFLAYETLVTDQLNSNTMLLPSGIQMAAIL